MRIKTVQLNAFTLLETVITILLTLILFGMLYMSYDILQRQVKKGSDDLSGILLVKLCLDVQMENAELVTAENERLEFYSPLKTNFLFFDKTHIILQHAGNRDTVYRGDYSWQVNTDPDLNLVDRVELEFVTAKDTVILCSRKNYLPVIRLNRKEADFEY